MVLRHRRRQLVTELVLDQAHTTLAASLAA